MADSILDGLTEFLGEYGVPISLAGQAASVYLRSQNEKRMRDQQQQLLEAERRRQAEIAARAQASFQSTMPQFQPQEIDARRQAEETRLRASLAPPAAPGSVIQNYQETVNANQPVAVGGDLTRRVAGALSEAQANAQRLALAKSFGNTTTAGNRTIARTGAEITSAGRDARASAGVLPYELQDSAYANARRNVVPDLLGGASGIAGLYGLTRRPKPSEPIPWWGTTERTF